MGASSSVQFNDAQKGEVTKKLLAIYHDPQNADKSTEELQALLVREYNTIVTSFSSHSSNNRKSTPSTPRVLESGTTPTPVADPKMDSSPSGKALQSKRTARDSLLQRSFDRDNGQSNKNSRKGPTRRRSFDQSASAESKALVEALVKPDTFNDIGVAEKLSSAENQSQSAPQMDISSTAVDSWDSVSTQPYCDICKMAFKNKAFLERHVKYSSLHIQNEKTAKAALGENDIEEKNSDNNGPENQPQHTPPPLPELDEQKQPEQEEGRDYRLLYSGSKFYWRTQHTVDFDIYHHFATKTIEIVPHNNTHQKEMNRIYINYESACQLVAHSVDVEVENKVKAIVNDRFAKQPDLEAIREDVLVQKMVTYLLSRLHFEADDGHGKAKITALSQDAFPTEFLHAEHPEGLIPIKVTRRRRSTAEEIDETINIVHFSLNTASQLSSEATAHAHRASTWDDNDPMHNHTPTHLGAITLKPVDENGGTE
jgi:hypothetical protein